MAFYTGRGSGSWASTGRRARAGLRALVGPRTKRAGPRRPMCRRSGPGTSPVPGRLEPVLFRAGPKTRASGRPTGLRPNGKENYRRSHRPSPSTSIRPARRADGHISARDERPSPPRHGAHVRTSCLHPACSPYGCSPIPTKTPKDAISYPHAHAFVAGIGARRLSL